MFKMRLFYPVMLLVIVMLTTGGCYTVVSRSMYYQENPIVQQERSDRQYVPG